MVNNLTLMFSCLFIGFLLIFGAFIDHHYAKEDARHVQNHFVHIKTAKDAKTAKDDLGELFVNHSEADIDAENTLAEFKKTRHAENLLSEKQRVRAFNNLFKE